jgi:PAP2 superfamily
VDRRGLGLVTQRPRPFGVEIREGWGGWAMPSMNVTLFAIGLVTILYTLVPEGRWRNTGKWVVTGLIALNAIGRIALGADAPTDVLVGAALGVTIPLLAYRWFTPNEVFPITYRRRRGAYLDVGGARGVAIRRGLADQLGLVATEVKPFGLAGSAGSTPLRITVAGDPPTVLFGKLYARSHLRSDRWYKLGRELLYGRLDDEKPFNTVRRLVQQEDYALSLMQRAGLPSPIPHGFVELTPEREYLLVTEGFAAARGLALPSQLRRMLRAQGRDLHAEFIRLLPSPAQPVSIQRWSWRRVGLLAATVALTVLLISFLVSTTNNDSATKTSLEIPSLDCTDLEPLWLQAQVMPSASLVPCVRTLPVGWSLANMAVNDGRSVITLHHDRTGGQAMEARLTAGCEVGQAVEEASGQPGVRRYQRVEGQGPDYRAVRFDVFPGGCVTTRIRALPASRAEVTGAAPAILGFTARLQLAQALEQRSGGRLQLDP